MYTDNGMDTSTEVETVYDDPLLVAVYGFYNETGENGHPLKTPANLCAEQESHFSAQPAVNDAQRRLLAEHCHEVITHANKLINLVLKLRPVELVGHIGTESAPLAQVTRNTHYAMRYASLCRIVMT